PSVSLLSLLIFPEAVKGVGNKKYCALQDIIAHIAVHPVCHDRRFPLVSRLAVFRETVFEIRFVYPRRRSVMFQDLQPCKIILMAVVMLHGESENSLPLYQH